MTMSIAEETATGSAPSSNNNNIKHEDHAGVEPGHPIPDPLLMYGPSPPAGARPLPLNPKSWGPPVPQQPGAPTQPPPPPPPIGWDPHQPPSLNMEPTYAPLVKVRRSLLRKLQPRPLLVPPFKGVGLFSGRTNSQVNNVTLMSNLILGYLLVQPRFESRPSYSESRAQSDDLCSGLE